MGASSPSLQAFSSTTNLSRHPVARLWSRSTLREYPRLDRHPFATSLTFYRTEKVIAEVHAAGAQDVDKAVQAAKKALHDPSWADLPPTDRGQMMYKLAELMEQNREVLATIDAWDNGTRVSSNSPSFHR